jgi:FkbM family methyltransferase
LIESKHIELLEKYNKLNQKSLVLMGLRKPSVSIHLLYERLKYRFFHKSTIIPTEMFFGKEMNLVLPEQVSEFLYYFRFFEYKLTKIVLECLKEGNIFVDIGAHFGYYSQLASELVGNSGEIHSFEPIPSSYEILKTNVKNSNQFTNNLACWSEDVFLDFNDYGLEFAAYNSFSKPRLAKSTKNPIQKIKVKTTTLDNYFKNKALPHFVKIDAESAELEVLKGMNKIINQAHPMITIEVGDLEDLPKSKDAIEYLLDKNYECYEFTNGKISKHIVRDSYVYDNLLFLGKK